MTSAADRMADGYEPRFDIDYEAGRQGELFVARVIDAVKDGSAEVKTDERAADTGNVYLEYECRYRGEWRRTCIATTPAELWCHVIGEVIIVAPTVRVREVARYFGRFPSYRRELTRGSHPTKGICIPINEFVRLLIEGPPEIQQSPLSDDGAA